MDVELADFLPEGSPETAPEKPTAPRVADAAEVSAARLPRLRVQLPGKFLVFAAVGTTALLSIAGTAWLMVADESPDARVETHAAPEPVVADAAPSAAPAPSTVLRPMRTTSIELPPEPLRREPVTRAMRRPPPASRQRVQQPAPTTAPSSESSLVLQAGTEPARAVHPVQTPTSDVSPPPMDSIYSAADADVVPPIQIYPHTISAREQPGTNATPVQIIIDRTGRVESAVLVRRPMNMSQTLAATLNIGAAKSWRFRPATRDGRPVKYRRIVWFADQ